MSDFNFMNIIFFICLKNKACNGYLCSSNIIQTEWISVEQNQTY